MKEVLIIDDEQESLRRVMRLLESKGLKAKLCADGDEGIEIYRREKPQIVLCDLFLPKKDGFAILKAIKEINVQARVFMLTAAGTNDYIEKAASLGAAGYIIKPLDLPLILNIAECFLSLADDDTEFRIFKSKHEA